MQFKTITNRKLPFFVALGLMAVLTSCGSYQYAGYDNDGIYASDDSDAEVEQPVVTTSTSDSNYYKNYFAENSAEVDAIKEESEIFTDVDSYEGNYTEQAQDSLEQRPAYGGWGQSNSTVTINYIDNGWSYGGWGFSSFGGWGYGWGYPGYGYGYGGWGIGWGWGYPGYGYGYPGYGYCYPGYGYGYNGYNTLAYSNTRRGSLLYNDNLSRSGGTRNSGLTRRDYASTGRNTAATRRNYTSTGRNTAATQRNYSTTRLSNAASPRNTRVRSNSSTRSVNSNGVTRSTRTTRPSTSTRTTRPSSTNRSIRSTAPSRSSGSARSTRSTRSSTSSARSSRSSGSRSSSGRSSSSSSGRKGRG